jgi:glycosyltransferase involved in cell wall biosynthesis
MKDEILPVSVIVLTLNEEKDLGSCLASISWCDDVHIVDSNSTDRTIEIAEKYGAKVISNPFKSFGDQRNWAMANCRLKHDWIFFLDADEHSDDAFYQGLRLALESAGDDIVGFYCCWKMILEGKWLKRSDSFPKWQFRILRKGRANFTDIGHGQKEGWVDGELAYLKTPYLHYAFSKGWSQWVERHNSYSSKEAVDRHQRKIIWKDIFSTTSSQRNSALKLVLSRVPGGPLLRFGGRAGSDIRYKYGDI